jgi:hypothetical protein
MPSGLKPGVIDATRYPDLRKWVVSSLSNHKKPNDIIFELCRRTDWDWNQAKRFVEQVVELDQKQVHQKRMPVLLLATVSGVVMGSFGFIRAYVEVLRIIPPPIDLHKIINATLDSPTLLFEFASVMVGAALGGFGVVGIVKSAITGEGEDILNPPPLK